MVSLRSVVLTSCVVVVAGWGEAATLTVATAGPNAAVVAVIPTAQLCNPLGGGTCVFTIAAGTQVRLTANSPSTPGMLVPSAPGTPVASVAASLVTLTWSAPTSGSPITGYTLVVRSVSGGPVVATLPVGNVTSLTGTAADGTYLVSVRAANAEGEGPESGTVTVVVGVVVLLPGAPQNLAATLTGTTAVITWTPPTSGDAPSGYWLFASSTPGGPVLGSVATGNVTFFAIPGMPAGVFYLRVLATNTAGPGPPSNEFQLNTAGCATPMAPQGLVAGLAGATATMSWDPVAGATSYSVLVQPAPGGPFAVVATLANTAISAPVNGAIDAWVSVLANNACGAGPMAMPQRLTTFDGIYAGSWSGGQSNGEYLSSVLAFTVANGVMTSNPFPPISGSVAILTGTVSASGAVSATAAAGVNGCRVVFSGQIAVNASGVAVATGTYTLVPSPTCLGNSGTWTGATR